MNLKNLLLVFFLIIFNSCALSLKVGEKTYPTQNPNIINAETLSYSQLRWKLRTDFNFRYDYAQYAMSQSRSFDWNNPLLNNRYRFSNPYLGYNYYWNRNEMWNDWLWGFTPHRWSIFGQDRWGYNNYTWNNPYGWGNYYGWNNWNTWNSHLNPNWGRSSTYGRRNASRGVTVEKPIKRRNVVRPRVIRNSGDRIYKPNSPTTPIPPVIRNNSPTIRNNPPNRNIRVNPPSRPPMNSRPQPQPVRRVKKNN